MTPVRIYGLQRCSTCVKARKWLDAHAIDNTFTDYRDIPLSDAVLREWADKLGWGVLINKASTSWRGLSDEQKQADTDAQWLALVAEHPTLVKRPVAVKGDDVMVGFSEDRYAKFFA